MTDTKTVHEQLVKIQKDLEAPKGQHNSFGNYNYRSCEDILGAVKPLLGGLVLTLNDEVVQLGDRFYVKATACLSDGKDSICNTAYAREQEAKFNKEGKETMDHAQITGSTSSYARKYALNGLFAIDDTKDADSMDNTSSKPAPVRVTAQMQGGTVSAPVNESDLGNCAKCGAVNAWSVKSNKAYCSKLCWKN